MSVSYSAHAPREPCRKHSRFTQPHPTMSSSSPIKTSLAFAVISLDEIRALLAAAEADALRTAGNTHGQRTAIIRIDVLKGKKARSSVDGAQLVRSIRYKGTELFDLHLQHESADAVRTAPQRTAPAYVSPLAVLADY